MTGQTEPLSGPLIVKRIAFYLAAAILLTIVGILGTLLMGVAQLVSIAFGALLCVMFVLAVVLAPRVWSREARKTLQTWQSEGTLMPSIRILLVLAALYYLLFVLTAWAGWHRFPWP